MQKKIKKMIIIPKNGYLNTILSGDLCCSFTICYQSPIAIRNGWWSFLELAKK